MVVYRYILLCFLGGGGAGLVCRVFAGFLVSGVRLWLTQSIQCREYRFVVKVSTSNTPPQHPKTYALDVRMRMQGRVGHALQQCAGWGLTKCYRMQRAAAGAPGYSCVVLCLLKTSPVPLFGWGLLGGGWLDYCE